MSERGPVISTPESRAEEEAAGRRFRESIQFDKLPPREVYMREEVADEPDDVQPQKDRTGGDEDV